MPRLKPMMVQRSFKYAALAALAIFILFPVYYMLVTSFKTQNEILQNPGFWILHPTLVNYGAIVSNGVLHGVLNSAIVAVSSTIVALAVSVLGGYSLASLRYRLRGAVRYLLIFAYLIPSTILFIPMTVLMADVGLIDTLPGLIICYLSFTTPLGTWLLMGFFQSLPPELEEQARVDGATRVGALWHILLPLTRPGMMAVGVIIFTAAWNEYLYALVLNISPAVYTLPLAISGLISGDVYRWGEIMAGSVIASLPVVSMYYLSQRFVIEGLTSVAVKG
ncbi:MAG: carbohydrate ABC transporter permease [Candidatus Dormiibacterota bacterium]